MEGLRWRALPGNFPPWPTVYTDFRNWRKDGTWQRIHDPLRHGYRIEQGRQPSPSEAIIDSQSVKSAAGLHEAIGYDASKQINGRTRLRAVETFGLLLGTFVTAASVTERAGAKILLERVKQLGAAGSRLVIIGAGGGFRGEQFRQWGMDTCRWGVQVVLRPQQTKGFQVLKKRWVVERTFGGLMHCRRLVRDYKRLGFSGKIRSRW